MKKNINILLLLTLFYTQVSAQYKLGVINDNYAGTYAIHLNPSSVANDKHRVFVNLTSANFNASSNYFRIKGGLSTIIEQDFQKSTLEIQPNGNYAGVHVDIQGPSALLRIGEKLNFAFGSRGRVILNGSNVSKSLIDMIKYEGDFESLIGKSFKNESINLNLNAFMEFYGTYATTLYNDNINKIAIGGTLKYLLGVSSAHLQVRDFDFDVKRAVEKGIQAGTTVTSDFLEVGYLDGQIYYSNRNYDEFDENSGKGIGLDLGASYTFSPNDEDDYLLKAGISVTDIGAVKYNTENTRAYNFIKKTIAIEEGNIDFEDPKELTALLGVDINDYEKSYKMGLPTMLNITADYRVMKKLYANLTWMQNLKSKEVIGMKLPSVLSISPRFESKLIGVSLPIQFTDNYKNTQVGLGLRLAFIHIGTENLSGLLAENINGGNLYFGAFIPIF